jgi:hypothetical protein
MRIKSVIAGVLALGLSVGSGVAMAHGGHSGKLSHGGSEGEWDDSDGGGYSTSSLEGIYVLRFSDYQNATGGATQKVPKRRLDSSRCGNLLKADSSS